MASFSYNKEAEIIQAFNSSNPYFEVMLDRIYPLELQFDKANPSDTETPFFYLLSSISNGFIPSKIYNMHDDFDFDIVNFPFLDRDVPCSISNGVYISLNIRFARVSSPVTVFNASNKILTVKLFRQGCCYNYFESFFKLYRRHNESYSKFKVELKSLFQQGLSEPAIYGDLVYKLRTIVIRLIFLFRSEKFLCITHVLNTI